MEYSAIVLAAGKGSRTNLEYNKVFYRFSDGEVLLNKTLSVFINDACCKQIIVVTTPDEIEIIKEMVNHDKIQYTYGGATRQDSVYQGLQKVKYGYVMIHDGARCFISAQEIEACKVALKNHDACLLMVPVIDTIKKVQDGYVVNTPLRSELYAAQTPQCFKSDLIKKCYQKGLEENAIASDDASLVELYSDVKIKVVQGEYTNKKVTTKEDLY
ncbi:MAG: 2-C-methyl-D-erythritol 4-phosphate cytidylyltransferase [Erysipelotrichia bacterium]|nr:2-C-methyl-D-erythritol 4-phosphate cytidylyltransferase [Erysipelotrichia bacterium]NCC54149.1 2-C-methyl-D-erythritol 4-phosphate cytidylyltransferase [Erysipelotrichia bacterium]